MDRVCKFKEDEMLIYFYLLCYKKNKWQAVQGAEVLELCESACFNNLCLEAVACQFIFLKIRTI